ARASRVACASLRRIRVVRLFQVTDAPPVNPFSHFPLISSNGRPASTSPGAREVSRRSHPRPRSGPIPYNSLGGRAPELALGPAETGGRATPCSSPALGTTAESSAGRWHSYTTGQGVPSGAAWLLAD